MSKPLIAVIVDGEADYTPLATHFAIDTIRLDSNLSDGERERQINAKAFESEAEWVLILYDRERVPTSLALEISRRATEQPSAWSYRILIRPFLGDEALKLASLSGRQEVRLYHKRYGKLDGGVVRSKGTVTRVSAPLHQVLFEHPAHQMAEYESSGIPHSLTRRIMLFALWAFRERALFSPVTLGYLWRRAAWDLSGTAQLRT